MALEGINTTRYMIGLLGVLNPDQAQAATDTAASAVGTFMEDPSSGSSDQDSSSVSQADFSQAASQLSALSQLQSKSPETFKALAQNIAKGISGAAAKSNDRLQKFMLATIAGQFSNAAASGSMASLATAGQGGQGNKTLRGYGASGISLLSPSMAQGEGADVFNQIGAVIRSNLAGLKD